MILVEMVHDARIIRMNATHDPSNIRRMLGDSVGHWEGDTLVVDTTNFMTSGLPRIVENLHVIERFTRVDANTILYRATIEDRHSVLAAMDHRIPVPLPPRARFTSTPATKATTRWPDILGGARKLESQQKNQEKRMIPEPSRFCSPAPFYSHRSDRARFGTASIPRNRPPAAKTSTPAGAPDAMAMNWKATWSNIPS